MPRQISLSAIIDLPDGIMEAAQATIAIHPAWQALVDSLKASNVKHVARCEMIETRAKPAASNGTGASRKRGPKLRAQGQPPAETTEPGA